MYRAAVLALYQRHTGLLVMDLHPIRNFIHDHQQILWILW